MQIGMDVQFRLPLLERADNLIGGVELKRRSRSVREIEETGASAVEPPFFPACLHNFTWTPSFPRAARVRQTQGISLLRYKFP